MQLYVTKQRTNSYLYVISGFCEQVLSSVERLNLETMVWQEMHNKLNVPRTKFGAVEIIDSVRKTFVVLGGKNSQSQRISTAEMYDCQSDQWTITEEFSLPKAKSGFACVSIPQP
jgi:hypothetical protein